MKHAFAPLERQSLSDRLARQISGSIQGGAFRRGDRLPPIMEMARRFGVGHPTIREALKKLEAMGVVNIRHGAGVFVSRSDDVPMFATQEPGGTLEQLVELRTRLGDAVAILEDIEQGGEALAIERVRPHLAAVHELIMRWEPSSRALR